MSYSDTELEAMMVDIESTSVERKESAGKGMIEKIGQAICAFANDLPDTRKPGVLFVNATDAGDPRPGAVSEQTIQTLCDFRNGRILPLPSMVVDKKTLRGGEVAVVTVQPSASPPVTWNQRIWVRTGPRRALASVEDIRLLNEKRRFLDRPADLRPLWDTPLSTL